VCSPKSRATLEPDNYDSPSESDQFSIPKWITPELVEDTIEVFRPYYEEELTEESAVEIIMNVGRLADALEIGGASC